MIKVLLQETKSFEQDKVRRPRWSSY